MKEESKKKKILRISGLIGLFLLVFGLSYALFTVTLTGTKKVKLKTGKLELQLLDANNNPIYTTGSNSESSYAIDLDNQVPVDDETGLGTEGFTFKLKNTGNVKAKYTIYLDDVALESNETRIDDSYVKYALTKNGSEENPQGLSSRELDKGVIEANNTTNEYTLKIWIAENADNEAMDKVFNATLRVEGTQYVQTGPFEEGTFAKTLYDAGTVGEYNAMTAKVPNGFDSTKEESGLYKYTDEAGTTTYAYRGTDVDNYVTFAGQTWRIIRIQSDGSVKLIKEDLLNFDSDKVAYSGNGYERVRYNNSSDNDDYSKYANSNIEGYVNEWYEATMTSYNNKIALNDYCSDRTEDHTSQVYQMIGSSYSSLYGLYNRASFTEFTNFSGWLWAPSVSCTTEIINAEAALITADEYILSGGSAFFGNNTTYLHSNASYWTMSPMGMSSEYGAIAVSISYSSGLNDGHVMDNCAVRPVITLKADIFPSSGDGTSEHPYVID